MILSVKEPKEDIFSRLFWQTNFQKNPYLPIFNNKNEHSKKAFIGTINDLEGKFLLKRSKPILLREFLPTVIIKGEFIDEAIIIKTRLGIVSAILLAFYLLIFYISFFSSLKDLEMFSDDFYSTIFILLFITIIPIVLIIAERKVTIDKIKEIIKS